MNAQSLRYKFAVLECIIYNMSSLDEPNIICVTETWVSKAVNGEKIKDFEITVYLFSYSRRKQLDREGVFVLLLED